MRTILRAERTRLMQAGRLLALVLVFAGLPTGCGPIDPPLTSEVYEARLPQIDSRVVISTTRLGNPEDAPKKGDYIGRTIRFEDGEGAIWHVFAPDGDPSQWEVWVAPERVKARAVPLRCVHKGISPYCPEHWPSLEFPAPGRRAMPAP